jgi:hypothetical protein
MSVPFRTFNSIVRVKALLVKGVKAVTTSTVSLTRAAHAGRTVVVDDVDGGTMTLPAASATGDKYKIMVGTALTSAALIVKVANDTDVFVGGVFINDIGDSTAATADFFPTASTSDTITLTQSIGAGKIGDWLEFEDVKAGYWAVRGVIQGVTDPSTPFSATV